MIEQKGRKEGKKEKQKKMIISVLFADMLTVKSIIVVVT